MQTVKMTFRTVTPKKYTVKKKKDDSTDNSDYADEEFVKKLVFMDSYPTKNDFSQSACLWLGTSLGSAFVLTILASPLVEESTNDEADHNQNLVVVPTSTIYRLKGPLLGIFFLEPSTNPVIISPPKMAWKDEERSACRRRVEGKISEASDSALLVILVSDRQIRVISEPSQVCLHKYKTTDDGFIVKAEAMMMKDVPVLVVALTSHHFLLLQLPALKIISDISCEDRIGESGSGKASRTLTQHVNHMEKLQVGAETSCSEISKARQAALERGEKLSDLEDRTALMKVNAEVFSGLSTQLKNKYKEKKWYQL
ncbi:hypothetical protein HELRODRAFT_194733 [Helobdella robusta]|uniref:V-SNARE coiled-coil homology domain-containing protein n=1 Tax=Helobdella robusta TaxID=6412 RepID=T1FWD0_HELRO|nr:hypothetical protein HELRODRAFT_194733 [Helobdella robusta]ESN89973.1 hypothetical protein HELRODRAFT_194733 [Helobdella robusta]